MSSVRPSAASRAVALSKYVLAHELPEHFADAQSLKRNGFLTFYTNALQQGESVCLCVAMSAGKNSFDPKTLVELDAFQGMALAWLEDMFATNDGSIQNVGITSRYNCAIVVAFILIQRGFNQFGHIIGM